MGGLGLGRRLAFSVITVAVVLGAVEVLGRLAWYWLEARAFARGRDVLRNDAINYMKVPDPHLGYVLKPGFARGQVVVNEQGFAQREPVSLGRTPGSVRVMALGESTTQGHDVDIGNYPAYLRKQLRSRVGGPAEVEVINAGVAGWVSDQTAIQVERHLVRFRPDVVVLYVGWNDFGGYDPLGPVATRSIFTTQFGDTLVVDRIGLKSVTLLSAIAGAYWSAVRGSMVGPPPGPVRQSEDTYAFFQASLHRIPAAFRRADPSVSLAICTLVGRWPFGTPEEFARRDGRAEWMKLRDVTPVQAALMLEGFNDLIRRVAKREHLILIDAAQAFSSLDRGRLLWDHMHMQPEGYELLAEVIYDGLVTAGAVRGERSERRDALVREYVAEAAAAR